jgi:hypothetical protein
MRAIFADDGSEHQGGVTNQLARRPRIALRPAAAAGQVLLDCTPPGQHPSLLQRRIAVPPDGKASCGGIRAGARAVRHADDMHRARTAGDGAARCPASSTAEPPRAVHRQAVCRPDSARRASHQHGVPHDDASIEQAVGSQASAGQHTSSLPVPPPLGHAPPPRAPPPPATRPRVRAAAAHLPAALLCPRGQDRSSRGKAPAVAPPRPPPSSAADVPAAIKDKARLGKAACRPARRACCLLARLAAGQPGLAGSLWG